MKLLVETNDTSQFEVLEEAKGAEKDLFITGTFIQTNIENRNKRIYPKESVSAEINRYVVESVNNSAAIGELNHPADPALNPERACIKIVELKEDGDNYTGKAKILQSLPMGSIVAGLIKEGVRMGVSTRALGSVKKNGNGVSIVQPDFRLITAADVVLDPSAPDAYVTALMESREWVYQNGVLTEVDADQVKGIINKGYIANMPTSEFVALFEKIITTTLRS